MSSVKDCEGFGGKGNGRLYRATVAALYLGPEVVARSVLARLDSLDWTRWVVTWLPKKPLVLLVDETSIGERFRVMMAGVAYKRRCVQLAWTCYKAKSREDYPIQGQVRMIAAMLAQLKTVLPDDWPVMVLADRGIGNSPAFCKAVEALG